MRFIKVKGNDRGKSIVVNAEDIEHILVNPEGITELHMKYENETTFYVKESPDEIYSLILRSTPL